MAAAWTPTIGGHFLGLIGLMVYSNQYHLDPMTATRPLEDDQPLGAMQSHRVIFKEVPFLHCTPATGLAVRLNLLRGLVTVKQFPHLHLQHHGLVFKYRIRIPKYSNYACVTCLMNTYIKITRGYNDANPYKAHQYFQESPRPYSKVCLHVESRERCSIG